MFKRVVSAKLVSVRSTKLWRDNGQVIGMVHNHKVMGMQKNERSRWVAQLCRAKS